MRHERDGPAEYQQAVHDQRNILDRRDHVARAEQRLNLEPHRADIEHRDRREIEQQHRKRVDHVGEYVGTDDVCRHFTRCVGGAFVLEALLVERADDADAAEPLAYDFVLQVYVFVRVNPERADVARYEPDDQQHQRSENDQHQRKQPVARKRESRAAEKEHRHRYERIHKIEGNFLQREDVVRGARNQAGGADGLVFLEGKRVDLLKNAALQIGGKTTGNLGIDLRRRKTADQHGCRKREHQCALTQNIRHVSVFDADIDDVAHEIRHEQRTDGDDKKQCAVDDQPVFIWF